jgi:hypothetical protein
MKSLSLYCALFICHVLYCQDTLKTVPKKKFLNSIQLELLGAGGVYSLNYERFILSGRRLKTTAQVGLSVWGNKEWKGISFPIAINEQISFGCHHIEIGVGTSPNYVNNKVHGKSWDYYLTSRFGYRYQLHDHKFIFRAGYTPLLYPVFMHWAGISFGYAF